MVECNSIEHGFHKTTNMYPNLSISNKQQQQLTIKKSMKLKIIY